MIVSSNGLVLTLATLVGKASSATVTLDDKRSYEATVWGLDEFRNMAVLRIQTTGLPVITMGDSSTVGLGQSVVVVGYDSGTTRPAARLGTVRGTRLSATTGLDYIETDAAVGTGGQGGPMVNSKGEMIGLFVSPSPNSFPTVGLTHAATSQSIASYMDKLKRGGKFFRPTPFASFPACSGIPPIPATYAGAVTVDGKPASGVQITAVVLDYVSSPVTATSGSYKDLTVGVPCGTYEARRITFYVDGFSATQTKNFTSGDTATVNLTVTTPPPP